MRTNPILYTPTSDKSAFLAFTNLDFTIMKLDEINVIVR
ncbi:hypothetical protein SRABI04_04484 [Chryseobacterium sp. Bi04]|nr:hypothetical protein SRABI04_04484 [Chryseobacterium sp. Bi04]